MEQAWNNSFHCSLNLPENHVIVANCSTSIFLERSRPSAFDPILNKVISLVHTISVSVFNQYFVHRFVRNEKSSNCENVVKIS